MDTQNTQFDGCLKQTKSGCYEIQTRGWIVLISFSWLVSLFIWADWHNPRTWALVAVAGWITFKKAN